MSTPITPIATAVDKVYISDLHAYCRLNRLQLLFFYREGCCVIDEEQVYLLFQMPAEWSLFSLDLAVPFPASHLFPGMPPYLNEGYLIALDHHSPEFVFALIPKLRLADTQGYPTVRYCTWDELVQRALESGHCRPIETSQSVDLASLLIDADVLSAERLFEVSRHLTPDEPLGRYLIRNKVCTANQILEAAFPPEIGTSCKKVNPAILSRILLADGILKEDDLKNAITLKELDPRPLWDVLTRFCPLDEMNLALSRQASLQQQWKLDCELVSFLIGQGLSYTHLANALHLAGEKSSTLSEALLALDLCDADMLIEEERRRELKKEALESRVYNIGDVLLRQGQIDEAILQKARSRQQAEKRPLGEILIDYYEFPPEVIIESLQEVERRNLILVERTYKREKQTGQKWTIQEIVNPTESPRGESTHEFVNTGELKGKTKPLTTQKKSLASRIPWRKAGNILLIVAVLGVGLYAMRSIPKKQFDIKNDSPQATLPKELSHNELSIFEHMLPKLHQDIKVVDSQRIAAQKLGNRKQAIQFYEKTISLLDNEIRGYHNLVLHYQSKDIMEKEALNQSHLKYARYMLINIHEDHANFLDRQKLPHAAEAARMKADSLRERL